MFRRKEPRTEWRDNLPFSENLACTEVPLNFESGIWMAAVPKESSQLESIIWNQATNVLFKIVF